MKWPKSHHHEWDIVGVNTGEYVLLGGMATAILYRCASCGRVDTRTIKGWWTIDQLKSGKK